MYELIGDRYVFIETEGIDDERKALGWGEKVYPDYVVSCSSFNQNKESYMSQIAHADIVITGSAPEYLLKERLALKKPLFFYSERPLKDNSQKWKYPFRLITWRKHNPQGKNCVMLCASAYTAADFSKFFLYRKRCYKWGYFPEAKTYEDVGALISGKQAGSILWCARMIDWKHPEVPILIAERLKNSGFSFRLNMIGCGPMQQQLEEMIKCKGLESHVFLLGSMSPQHVRSEMEKSEVFLFTSDRNEGWGAVLNEAMNSACAVVASHAIGSVPFLINDKENGLIYKDGSIDEIYRHVVCLLTAPALRRSISEKAYFTIVNEWNAKNAAHRFLRLAEEIISGKTPQPFEKGLCSCAEVLKDDWYR